MTSPVQPTRSFRLGSVLSAFVLLAAFVAALPLTLASPAFAGECPITGCVTTGNDGNGGQGDVNPNQDQGGGSEETETYTPGSGDGGSGGVVTPGTWTWAGKAWLPTEPPTPMGGTGFRGKLWSPDSNVYRWSSVNRCAGTAWTDPNGKAYGFLGTSWFLSGTHRPPYIDEGSEDIIPDTYTATAGGYECIEPPKYRIEPWDCILGANGAYKGPMMNGESPVRPSREVKFEYEQSDFVQGGKRSLTDCRKSQKFNFETPSLKFWGQYEIGAQAQMQTCEYYEYFTINQRTGTWNQNYLDCRGGPKYWVNPADDRVELFCPPPHLHKPGGEWHTDHSYNAEDCKGGPGATWTCGPVPTPVFNGRTSPNGKFEVLDDGKDRRLKWDRPAISGDVRNIENRTVNLALGRDVSPFRAGETTNGSRQPFKVVPDVDEWRSGWRQAMPADNNSETGWDMAFMAPGVPGKPFAVTPRWAFQAEFLTQRVSNVRIDPFTNQTFFTFEDYWYTADASCPGAPAELDVYRARNSQGR
jgi:hypothetical protein